MEFHWYKEKRPMEALDLRGEDGRYRLSRPDWETDDGLRGTSKNFRRQARGRVEERCIAFQIPAGRGKATMALVFNHDDIVQLLKDWEQMRMDEGW